MTPFILNRDAFWKALFPVPPKCEQASTIWRKQKSIQGYHELIHD